LEDILYAIYLQLQVLAHYIFPTHWICAENNTNTPKEQKIGHKPNILFVFSFFTKEVFGVNIRRVKRGVEIYLLNNEVERIFKEKVLTDL
jgi:hypothetical protein